LRVSQVMTRLSICLYLHNTIGDALALMKEKKVEGLPLVNEQGHLQGVVTKEEVLEKALEEIAAGDKAVDFITARFLPLKEEALVKDVWNLPFQIYPVLNNQDYWGSFQICFGPGLFPIYLPSPSGTGSRV